MLRVLFVLADTDRSERNLTATELHRELAVAGIAMRTVALAPGHLGGLDEVVPVLSWARWSPSAVTQLRREQRWADAVVCWDPVAARVQRWSGLRRRLPTAVVDECDPGATGGSSSWALKGATLYPPGDDVTRWSKRLASLVGRDPHRP